MRIRKIRRNLAPIKIEQTTLLKFLSSFPEPIPPKPIAIPTSEKINIPITFCPGCGKKLDGDEKFCKECGYEI